MRGLRRVCVGDFSNVFNVREPPIPIQELLKKNVVLELEALSNADKAFFIEALLLWIHHFRLGEAGPREKLRHVIFIEEAHHILSKLKQHASGEEAVTDIIMREIGEFGEGVVDIAHEDPSLGQKRASDTLR